MHESEAQPCIWHAKSSPPHDVTKDPPTRSPACLRRCLFYVVPSLTASWLSTNGTAFLLMLQGQIDVICVDVWI